MKQRIPRISPGRPPRSAERGAALVIAAAVITTVLAFAALVAGRATRMELRGAYQGSDALQALLAAETGLQRAAKRITNLGTACGAAAINETIAYPAGVSVVIASKTTDFDGVTALTPGMTGMIACRIEATATVTATNVTRKLSQIVDTSLFDNTVENLAFDSGAPPTGWTFSGTSDGGVYYKTQGGSEAALPPCTASALVLRSAISGGTRTTLGDTSVYFNAYQAAGTIFTLTIDRRYIASGADSTGNSVVLRFKDSTAVPVTFPSAAQSLGAADVSPPPVPSPNPPYGGGANCSSSYALNQTLTINVPATVVNPISTAGFTLTLGTSTRRQEAYLDRIRVTGLPPLPSGGSYLRVLRWRECVPSPNSCV